MTIPFTQYLRPDGRRQHVGIDMSQEIEAMAQNIRAAGYVFECECLNTNPEKVSFTITRHDDTNGDAGDVVIKICNNGPDVPKTIEALVRDGHKLLLPNTRVN